MKSRTLGGALSLLLALVGLGGCSAQKMVIRYGVTPAMNDMLESVNDQRDPDTVEAAIPSNLILIQGMADLDPENEALAVLAAQAYCSFAQVFVMERDRPRASILFDQGREHAVRALASEDAIAASLAGGDVDSLIEALAEADEDAVPALFWGGMCWAGFIDAAGTPVALAALPKVEAIMNRLAELDEEYYFGGPLLFLGLYNAKRPRMLGGDPDKAKEYFERVFEITEGRFLLAKVYYAEAYARQIQDQELFEATLQEVIDAPDDVMPGQRLVTAVAKRRAEALLAEADDYF